MKASSYQKKKGKSIKEKLWGRRNRRRIDPQQSNQKPVQKVGGRKPFKNHRRCSPTESLSERKKKTDQSNFITHNDFS